MTKQNETLICTIVKSSEWAGLYVDGILEYENYSMSSGDVYRIIGHDNCQFTDEMSLSEKGLMMLARWGCLPESFEELQPYLKV